MAEKFNKDEDEEKIRFDIKYGPVFSEIKDKKIEELSKTKRYLTIAKIDPE